MLKLTTSPLYKSIIGDKYNLVPNRENSVTSVTQNLLQIDDLSHNTDKNKRHDGIYVILLIFFLVV